MKTATKNPDALAGAFRADRLVFADVSHTIQTPARPQLLRLGDTSKLVAFLDCTDGTALGWLAKGLDGWNAVRTGSAQARSFRTALGAARFVVGDRS